MKKIVYTLAAIALLGLIAWGLRPQPTQVDLGTVSAGPMKVTVDEEGKTRIKERYTVIAPLSGQMKRVTLKPGDPVAIGQTILTTIEPTDPALLDARAIAAAKARVSSAKAAKDQAGQMHEKARVAQEYAETEYRRARSSTESHSISDQAFKEAELLWHTRQLELKATTFAEQIANFELEQAEAALLQVSPGTVGNEPPRMVVPSPINGVVLNVRRESAGVVQAGSELVELGDPRDLEVVVQVLSRDAVAIRPGAETIFEQWGGEKPLAGRVRRVEPAGFTKISALGVEEQRVNVLIDFVDPYEVRSTLGDGFRVEARIVVWQKESVLRAPAGALFRRNGDWAAYVVEDGAARLRKLSIGHANALEAEVLEGLANGEHVIMHPGDKVKDGSRIVVRE
ncbi:MAG: efflux RND transporter periplasmic adaptor subunit [Gemmataceae bacterium]